MVRSHFIVETHVAMRSSKRYGGRYVTSSVSRAIAAVSY